MENRLACAQTVSTVSLILRLDQVARAWVSSDGLAMACANGSSNGLVCRLCLCVSALNHGFGWWPTQQSQHWGAAAFSRYREHVP